MTWEYAATLLSCINAHAQKNVFFSRVVYPKQNFILHENPFPFPTFRVTDWSSFMLSRADCSDIDCHHSFPASLTNKLMDLICCNCLLPPSSAHSFSPLLSSPPFSSPLRPVDRLLMSWKRDGRRLSSGQRLIIPAPTSSDTGLYVCEASFSNSTAKPVETKAHLTVMGKKKKAVT